MFHCKNHYLLIHSRLFLSRSLYAGITVARKADFSFEIWLIFCWKNSKILIRRFSLTNRRCFQFFTGLVFTFSSVLLKEKLKIEASRDILERVWKRCIKKICNLRKLCICKLLTSILRPAFGERISDQWRIGE